MIVALQISGQQRYGAYFPQLLESLRVFDDLDIFFHHWAGPHDEDAIKSLVTHGSVREIKIEPQIDFQVDPAWRRLMNAGSIFNMMSAAYSIKQANQLRLNFEQETGTVYDLVIRARSDIRLRCLPQHQSWYTRWFKPKLLYVGNPMPHFTEFDMPDQFAIGQPETINIYAQLFDNFQKYHDTGHYFNPEQLLWWHLNEHGIEARQDVIQVDLDTRGGLCAEDRSIY